MENAYGIGVTNRYHLFLDDDADPLELLQLQERERELKKRTKLAEKENKVKTEPKAKVAQVPRKTIKESENKVQEPKIREEKPKSEDNNRSERVQRNTGRFSGENREDRNNRRNREDSTFNGPAEKEWKPRRDFTDNEGGERRPFAGRGRGGRGNFDGRGGRGNYENRGGRSSYEYRGKREHESQPSDASWDKRDSGDTNKWSKSEIDQTNLNKTEQPEVEVSWDTEPTLDAAPVLESTEKVPETEEETTDAAAVAIENEPKELTLDEWKAQRGVRQKPNYNLRKAGEGEDPSQWKKMYALDKKREGHESEHEEDLEFDISDYPQRVGRQKHVLDIQFTFNDTRRGGGGTGRGWGRGRGGRGQGRGFSNRGDRSGPRPPFKNDDSAPVIAEEGHVPEVHTGRGRQNAPKVDDEHDFPSLG